MGMAHVTSGRATFTYQDLINTNPSTTPKSFIPKSLLKRMLIRENELRLSDEYQKRYCEAEKISSSSSWLNVTDELQRQIIHEFNLDDEMDDALLCLRCATQIYPDLKHIPLYVQYNRARDGDLKIGDIAPNVPVVQLNGQQTQLFDGLKSSSTVLIDLYNVYYKYINFRFIYILEAHAQDEWPICSARWSPTEMPIQYNQTHTIEERLAVAKDFIRDFSFQMSIVIDKPEDNLFEKLYSSWPVRIYVIDKDYRLTYIAQPSESMLELNELIEHLQLIMKSKE
ncbi:unnamed protein product [Rotaria sp. Silwood1]|nr:unnamed protein product [Rotaria sp. Silwood1]CAF0735992.1 unnamed protein product [Rotaria sp. Silwood1]CAF3344142.1 unnamed protein product [Rotaria sp. Silwood1]CAF3749600.1 unnamed protein product [Rotaria sp. Silwood1]CAF4975008.1 unnamed protein product [Rotaria sp. Silwood1]